MNDKYLAIRLANGRFIEISRFSISQRFDYLYYLRRLHDYLKRYPNSKITSLYLDHGEFKHLATKCLDIAGIPADQLNPEMFIELLFASDKYPYGLLNQFNFDFTNPANNEGDPDTQGGILGKLYKNLGDLKDATFAMQSLPSDVLEEFLEEMKPPEEKSKLSAMEYIKKHGVPLPKRAGQ